MPVYYTREMFTLLLKACLFFVNYLTLVNKVNTRTKKAFFVTLEGDILKLVHNKSGASVHSNQSAFNFNFFIKSGFTPL